jgi:hypothetical protein
MLPLILIYGITLYRRRRWLRQYATGSIPYGVTGTCHLDYPSSRTMALASTQPLTKVSTKNIFSVVKAAGA